MVLRVKPTPRQFPTSSFYIPTDNTLLHSIISACYPCGCVVVAAETLRLVHKKMGFPANSRTLPVYIRADNEGMWLA